MTIKAENSVPVAASQYQEVSQTEKLQKKIKENPLVPIGIVGMFSMVGYGIYNFQRRGNMSASVYLMSLRVKAQAMVVGAMTLGVGLSLANEYILKPRKEEGKK